MKSGLYKKILTILPEGVLVLDKDFNVVFANDWFKNLLKKDELEGKVTDFIEDYQYETSEKDYIIKKFDTIVDDEKLAIKVNTKKIEDGYVLLVSLLKECICLDVIHNDFISTVSHEMRTPLTSMKGFVDTILASGDRLDAAQKDRFLRIVKQQIERLTRLVENLLTVSRLENRKIKDVTKAIDMGDFSKMVIAELKAKHTEHIFEVVANPSGTKVLADYDKMHQVMTNLIDNAAKYSLAGTLVEIVIFEGNDLVNIAVKDHGVGISGEYLGKIFNKFMRIDNPLTREAQGTGLGLYITKTLVESMNGKISVESEVGKGTIFTVSLPAATTENQAKQRFMQDVVK